MTSTYEIRTMRGRPVFSFDDIARAKDALRTNEKRLGIKLRLVEITRVEKELSL